MEYKVPKSTLKEQLSSQAVCERLGERSGNCCLGNRWELQVVLFPCSILFGQNSLDVPQERTALCPSRDSFPSLRSTGSSNQSLVLDL